MSGATAQSTDTTTVPLLQPPNSSRLQGSVRPENQTLVERFVGLSHLPYLLACMVYSFVLFGILDFFILAASVDQSHLLNSLGATLDASHIVSYTLGAYLLYSPRYMRLKTLEAEPSISRMLGKGEPAFHKLFGNISKIRPQLIAWLLSSIGLLGGLVLVPDLLGGSPFDIKAQPGNPLFQFGVYAAIVAAFAFYGLGLSGSAWSYYSLSKGIHWSGSQPLKFRSCYDDRFLGLRPWGTLAFSLALAYFGAIVLFIGIIVFSVSPPIGIVIGVSALASILIVLGLAMFFLPLRRLHLRMREQKTKEEKRLSEKLGRLLDENPTSHNEQSLILDSLKLQLIDRKVSSIASWPFDLEVLSKLTLVIVSVTAALITRVMTLILGI